MKPWNVKLRPDGTVKVLDLGLAKIMDGPAKAGHYEGTGDRSVRQPDLAVSPARITQPPIEVITNWAQNVGLAKSPCF